MLLPLQQARKCKAAGDLDGAARVLEEALREGAADIEVLRELADVRARRGQMQRAHEALDAALQLLNGRTDPEAIRKRAELDERRSWIHFREGNILEARSLCLDLLARLGDGERSYAALLADVHNTLGGVAWQEGRIDDAMAEIGKSITLYDAAKHRVGAAHSRLNLGVLCFSRGDWNRARRYLVQSRRIRAGAGWLQGMAANLLNLGLLEMASGKLTQARRYLEESEETSRNAGEEHDRVLAVIALAHLDLLERRIDDAAARLEPVLRMRTLTDDAHAQALWLMALVELARGAGDRALQLARESRRRARTSGSVDSEADACRALGVIHRAERHFAEAKTELEESIALAKKADDPYRRGLALFELSTVLHALGDGRAAELAAEAMGIFRRLGARYDLTRAKFKV